MTLKTLAAAVIALVALTACQNTPTDNPSTPTSAPQEKKTTTASTQSPKPPTENEQNAAAYRDNLKHTYGVTVPGSDRSVYKQLKEICERARNLGRPAALRWAQYGPLNIDHTAALNYTVGHANGTCK